MKTAFVYVGKRLTNKNILAYAYKEVIDGKASDRDLLFKKRLMPMAIGDTFTLDWNGEQAKGPYNKVGEDFGDVTNWSIKERDHVEEKKIIQASKVKHDGHIDALIGRINRHVNFNYRSRERIAMYIYLKILKG